MGTIAFSSHSAAEEIGSIAEMSLYNHIRPAFSRLLVRVNAFRVVLEKHCAMPSAKSLRKVRHSFREALDGWARVEHLRFGPLTEKSRLERLAYWPDRKSRGLRQVRQALQDRDDSVLDVEKLVRKSVALQGFTALEYVLFGDGAKSLEGRGPESKFRCGYGLAISENISSMARDINDAWWDEEGYTSLLLDPSSDNPVYRTHREVILELFKAFTSGLENVEDLKIRNPLGQGIALARGRRAAFWRSSSAKLVIAANIESLREMFSDGGFAKLIEKSSPGKQDVVDSILQNAASVVKTVNLPIEKAVSSESERSKLVFVSSVLGSIRGKVGALIAVAADLSLGFRASDGD